MRVGKIGHASIVVSSGDVCCFMDPILSDPFESNTNTFDPPIEIDSTGLRDRCNVIVLSHGHMDHFAPRALALFDRDTPVVYPRGDALIRHALDRLGFEEQHPVVAGDQLDLGDMTLHPTRSQVPFPEMGMAFESEGRVLWNLVDTVIDERAIGPVRERLGDIDLLLAKYQPLVENPIRTNALGSDFPTSKYGELLANVLTINPRYVAPGSCGYRYCRDDWMNDRGFPITERQFEADLRTANPDLKVIHLPHGGAVNIEETMEVEPDGLPFVRRTTGAVFSSFDWRPERGVPPLRDRNARGHSLEGLRKRIELELNQTFLPRISHEESVWRSRMKELGVVWRLELVYPDGTSDVRLLDLTAAELRWSPYRPDVFVKLHTSISASAIVDVLDGWRNFYSLTFNDMRIVERLYRVHRGGASRAGGVQDEPLSKFLLDRADAAFIENELRIILGEAGDGVHGRS